MKGNVYLVEDEKNLNVLLKTYLEKEQFNVKSFLDGKSALEKVNEKPDLWILDIMLPDIDGYQLIKEIKNKNSDMPVIFISARNQELDRVVGLEMGCDDYLAKPFLPRELVIRTKNLLERREKTKEVEKTIKIGEYILDKNQRTIIYNNTEITLTTKEFNLLLYLVNNKNIAISRDKILSYVWSDDYFGSDRVVDDTLRRLRKKMPKLKIETIYGFGYKLVEKL